MANLQEVFASSDECLNWGENGALFDADLKKFKEPLKIAQDFK